MILPDFSIIAACDLEFGIGINNKLPWKIPQELQYFQRITDGSTVIMGRKTWDSLPSKSKPLANRRNIVISRNLDLHLPENVILASSLLESLLLAKNEPIFVIGGSSIYFEAIQHKNCKKVYLTKVLASFDCDTYFPKNDLEQNFVRTSCSDKQSDNGYNFQFEIYERKNKFVF